MQNIFFIRILLIVESFLNYVPYDFVTLHTPFIYLVDSFLALQNNAFWFIMRNTENDIIIDINGAICSINELVKGIY